MEWSSKVSLEVTNFSIGVDCFVEIRRAIMTFEFQGAFADNKFEAVLGEFFLYSFWGRYKPRVL